MIAYEFYAETRNDGCIQIPIEYRNNVSKKVKVILLSEEYNERKAEDKPNANEFPYFAVDTTSYVFDREEAHER